MTTPSDPSDLQALPEQPRDQQERLQFQRFTNDHAVDLGWRIVALARERELVITVDIRRHSHQLFHVALPGTTPDNDSWIERKVRVVNRFNESSFLVGRRLVLAGRSVDIAHGLDPLLWAAHGGSLPMTVRDVGVVGTVTVSRLPQADDHALVVEALTSLLGIEPVG